MNTDKIANITSLIKQGDTFGNYPEFIPTIAQKGKYNITVTASIIIDKYIYTQIKNEDYTLEIKTNCEIEMKVIGLPWYSPVQYLVGESGVAIVQPNGYF